MRVPGVGRTAIPAGPQRAIPGPIGAGTLPPWLAPAGLGAAGVAAVATVAVLDPNEAGHYPTCPFLATTGLFCPGCGTLRAVHALTRGDLAAAVDLNVLTVVLLPVLAVAWLLWLAHALGRRPTAPDLPSWAGSAIAVVVPIFWVVRNLPVGSALAP